MIVTVLWEDQRGNLPKLFGPDELLLACLVDKTGRERDELKNIIKPVPKKGVGKILKTLKDDLERLAKTGPVVAVMDRDRVRDVWKKAGRPPDCMTAIRDRILEQAPGTYEVVFLMQNIESVVDVCCDALGKAKFENKPKSGDRDAVLQEAAWASDSVRGAALSDCPSFARIVDKVSVLLP